VVTPESFDERRLDRRAVLGISIGALGAFALGLPLVASAAGQVPVWRLDPVHRQGPGGYSAGCSACHACREHAQNKIFASKSAAAKGRAHEGCTCTVVRTSISEASFVQLFGPVEKPARLVFDRRWTASDKRKAAARSAKTASSQKKVS
jgi:S-formylglutathione hydrolase FrmB